MDVIESSHFEVVKNWLQENPGHVLKLEKIHGLWVFRIYDARYQKFYADAFSFGAALKKLSNQLTGVGNNERSSDSRRT